MPVFPGQVSNGHEPPRDTARELGEALRGCRLDKGLSFRALARQLGLSAHSGLADYESGRRIPPEDLIRAYERVFDVPAGSLKELRNRAFAQRAQDRRPGAPVPVAMPRNEPGPSRGNRDKADSPDRSGQARDRTRRFRVAAWAVTVVAVSAAAVGVLATIGHDVPAASRGQAARTPGASPAPGGLIDMNAHGVQEPVRRVGSVTLPAGEVIDLDSPPDRPWTIDQAPRDDPYDLEFYVTHLSVTGINHASLGVLPPGSAGLRKECGTLQAYGAELGTASIRSGALLCVITDQRRYALLRITGVQRSADGRPSAITFSIRVWENRDAS